VVDAQKAHAGTLMGRELEAACVATFIYSQPIGEQAEVAGPALAGRTDLRPAGGADFLQPD